jgi:hypothetical protein
MHREGEAIPIMREALRLDPGQTEWQRILDAMLERR